MADPSIPRPPAGPAAAPARSPRRRLGAAVVLWTCVLLLALVACTGEAPLPGDPLRFSTGQLPDPVLAEPYRGELAAAGGLRPYAFRLESGALPPGLRLQGGVVVGEPTELGRYEFTVAVTDGNLARNVRTYAVTVRDVPVPTVRIEVPETEVRDRTTVRTRIEGARDLRAIRLRLTWGDAPVRLAEDAPPASRRSDVALFFEERDDGVAIDLAVLGDPWTGDGDLFAFDLEIEEATRLSLASESELLYSGRHAYRSDRFGAPRSGPDEEESATEDEGPASEADGDGPQGDPEPDDDPQDDDPPGAGGSDPDAQVPTPPDEDDAEGDRP